MGIKTDVSKIIGQRFGRLTIVGDAGQSKRLETKVFVRCDCGTEKEILLHSIISKNTKSCGCIQKEVARNVVINRNYKHGLTRHPLFHIWNSMKLRCYSKRSKSFQDYGGRGVIVCEYWKNNFHAFYDFAIKNGWKHGLEIDRINNDGNYEPGNCQFVKRIINANNRKTLQKNNTTGFRGVTWTGSSYMAQGNVSSAPKLKKRGFKTALEAAIYRDNYYKKLNIETVFNFS